MGEKKDPLNMQGEREDAEIFEEENLVDAAWIPHGFAWNSPSALHERAREIEAEAADRD